MAHRQLPGQASSPPDRMGAMQPVEEHVEGTVFPYRGMETHGVTPAKVDYDTEKYQIDESDLGPEDPEYLPAEPEPIPIPVVVVNKSARERLSWRPVRFRVTDQGRQILGRNDKRKSVRLKVAFQTDGVDSKPVFIGEDSGVQPFTGFQVDRGETLFPITSTEEIWAICNPGESVDVFMIVEFAVEL